MKKLSTILDKKYSHTTSHIDEQSKIRITRLEFHDLEPSDEKIIHEFITKAMQAKYDRDFNSTRGE